MQNSMFWTFLNCYAGDDCISIQTGCSNVYVHNVDCGPGHGISIGGLGKDNTRACVSNITVRDVNMHNTMNGVRIKTWQVKKIPICSSSLSENLTSKSFHTDNWIFSQSQIIMIQSNAAKLSFNPNTFIKLNEKFDL